MTGTRKSFRRCRRLIASVLTAVIVFGCGLGMDAEARIERGQAAYDNAQYQAAIVDARSVLQQEPDNIAARILLARALIEVADGVTAEKEIRRAADLGASADETLEYLGRSLLVQGKFADAATAMQVDDVDSPEARRGVLRVLGHALVGNEQAEAARTAYAEVLTSVPDDIESQLGIVNSYIVERNFVQARATMYEILTIHDDDVSAWLTSASLAMRLRDAVRAASDYGRALALLEVQPNPAREMRALAGYAEALLLDDRLDEARGVLSRMQFIAPEDARTRLVTARVATLDKNWLAAQAELHEILNLSPDYRPAQVLLGALYKETGNLRQAEMYLSAVVASTPENANARRLLAETRLLMNKSAAAREAIDSVIAGPNADARSLSIAAAASFDLGAYEDAIELLQRRFAGEPDNVDLRIQLALAYFRAGNGEQVQALLQDIPGTVSERNDFRRDLLLTMSTVVVDREDPSTAIAELLQRWPAQAEAYNLAGAVAVARGEPATARTHFSRAAELAPEDANPIRYLAQIDETDGMPDAARTRYMQLLEMDESDTLAMLALSRLASLAANRTESIEWLEKARAADPTAIAPRELLGARYLADRNFATAAVVASEGLELEPDNARLHNIVGYARFATDDLRGAMSAFRRAATLDTDEPNYTLNLARAQDRNGDPGTAVATLEESMARTLQHPPSGVLLTWLHIRADDLETAADVADELWNRHPNVASVHVLRAEVAIRQGDLAAASAAYDRASAMQVEPRFAVRAFQIRKRAQFADPTAPLTDYLEKRPFDTTVRLLFAQSLQRDGDTAGGYEQYEKILEYEPDNLVAGNNLAWAYFKNGDPRAEATARQAYDNHPGNSAIIDTLGWIMVNGGDLEGGIALLRNAVRLSGGSGESRYHLAAALDKAGEREEAREILQDLLSSATEFSSRGDAERLLATF